MKAMNGFSVWVRGVVSARGVALAALAAACLTLTGCVYGRGDWGREKIDFPAPGDPVSVSFWHHAKSAIGQRGIGRMLEDATRGKRTKSGAERGRFWLIPYVKRGIVVNNRAEDNGLDVAHYSSMGLGIEDLAFLPVWRNLYMDSYETPEHSPFRSLRLRYCPLWAGTTYYSDAEDDDEEAGEDDDSEDGEQDGEEPEDNWSGIPLLYHVAKGDGLYQFNLLWDLGPEYRKLTDHPGTIPYAGIWNSKTSQRTFVPLKLGGLAGSLLWLHHRVWDDEWGFACEGPLLGIAGWQHSWGEDEGKLIDVHLLLQGYLWVSYTVRDAATGRPEEIVHGTLASMVGWGKKNGRWNIRLLWIPIPIPGLEEKAAELPDSD